MGGHVRVAPALLVRHPSLQANDGSIVDVDGQMGETERQLAEEQKCVSLH
jgi:hypothetical protein